ncbi:multidrug resistance efflux transporter family protein [Solilutibacter tolerans]|uniref:Putative multidrug resistance efflux transporter n=1 Tax=Solilutibacter tolerans TaxID=1604334 RepID=A0A1N6RYV3_9GAMM|nr:multidrug resistance efflux transporter family protein [Lysobacter tolerans]SIQ34043.1 Putative multidrug resistance efflux transporter [Lysobacter tolerans]
MSHSTTNTRTALVAVLIALASALFFTLTYVLNRATATEGGHWAWTASLRYLITLPLMIPLMRGRLRPLWAAMCAHPIAWLGYSALGFVLFYMLMAYAADSGPAWLVAGSFQFTVIAGMLCAPFLYRDARRKVPLAAWGVGLLILAGVMLMQFSHADGGLDRAAWVALACVLGSAILYPLGNRLLLLHLERTGEQLDATQRVFGMTLASQPWWLLVAMYAFSQAGTPSASQVWMAAGVALSAGVIATILFFKATGLVRDNPTALAAAEAMQAAELIFASILGVFFLHEAWPQGGALVGSTMIVVGILLFAWVAARSHLNDPREVQAMRTEQSP